MNHARRAGYDEIIKLSSSTPGKETDPKRQKREVVTSNKGF